MDGACCVDLNGPDSVAAYVMIFAQHATLGSLWFKLSSLWYIRIYVVALYICHSFVSQSTGWLMRTAIRTNFNFLGALKVCRRSNRRRRRGRRLMPIFGRCLEIDDLLNTFSPLLLRLSQLPYRRIVHSLLLHLGPISEAQWGVKTWQESALHSWLVNCWPLLIWQ